MCNLSTLQIIAFFICKKEVKVAREGKIPLCCQAARQQLCSTFIRCKVARLQLKYERNSVILVIHNTLTTKDPFSSGQLVSGMKFRVAAGFFDPPNIQAQKLFSPNFLHTWKRLNDQRENRFPKSQLDAGDYAYEAKQSCCQASLST